MSALFQNSRDFCQAKLKPKVEVKLNRIKVMLSQALEEIHSQDMTCKSSISSSSAKRRSDQSSEGEEIQEVMASLRRGYLVIKHSVSSKGANHRFVFTSEDGRYFCWKSLDSEDEKRIELISISRIVREGVEFFLKASYVKNISHCLVIMSEDKKLQLELGSEMETEYLRYELQRAVKYSRNMCLNYKYCKN